MQLPNSEYFKNLKPGITPWVAIATTIMGKKYPSPVICGLFKKNMPTEDYQPRNKNDLLGNLLAISYNLRYEKNLLKNPLFSKDFKIINGYTLKDLEKDEEMVRQEVLEA